MSIFLRIFLNSQWQCSQLAIFLLASLLTSECKQLGFGCDPRLLTGRSRLTGSAHCLDKCKYKYKQMKIHVIENGNNSRWGIWQITTNRQSTLPGQFLLLMIMIIITITLSNFVNIWTPLSTFSWLCPFLPQSIALHTAVYGHK